jgi:hypothetical protein
LKIGIGTVGRLTVVLLTGTGGGCDKSLSTISDNLACSVLLHGCVVDVL